MNEHNGGDHVTWRDLDAMGLVREREIDRRFKENERAIETAKIGADEARTIARQGVRDHDEEKNNLLAQINKERAEFARIDDVERLVEKAALALEGEIGKLRTAQNGIEKDVRDLQNKSNTTAGRDLGKWAVFVSLGLLALSFLFNVSIKVIFG